MLYKSSRPRPGGDGRDRLGSSSRSRPWTSRALGRPPEAPPLGRGRGWSGVRGGGYAYGGEAGDTGGFWSDPYGRLNGADARRPLMAFRITHGKSKNEYMCFRNQTVCFQNQTVRFRNQTVLIPELDRADSGNDRADSEIRPC